MGKIITSFSNKGGVGKTTVMYNLACELADQNQKVLLIDADAQMNLTALIFRLSTGVEYDVSSLEQINRYQVEQIENDWHNNLKNYLSFSDYIETFIQNKTYKQQKIYRYNEAARIQQELELSSDNVMEQKQTGYIDFLPSGSKQFYDLEVKITDTIMQGKKNNLVGNHPHLFQKALNRFRDLYDFILIDTAPSFSVFNGLFVLSSDYFFTTIRPDFFSLQSIDNLSTIFNRWIDTFKAYEKDRESDGMEIKTRYLGSIINMKKKYSQGESDNIFAQTSNGWQSMLNRRLKKACVDISRVNSLEIDDMKYKYVIDHTEFEKIFCGRDPYILEEFLSISEKMFKVSEVCKIPLIHINQNIIINEYNIVAKTKINDYEKTYLQSIEETKKSYSHLAECFINNLQ
jgi:cellulose biosynthesis protein BcsQ